MPYRYYYQHIQHDPRSESRTVAQVYPGAVVPTECNFGRVHGSSPATGEITFKGLVVIPPAMEIQINVGSSVFFGIATKVDTDNNLSTGNTSRIRLLDYRDRLLDVNHFAQYNMVDSTGTWWHILPDDWAFQRRRFIHKMQDLSDFSETQELPDYNLNQISGRLPMFSMFSILSFFAELYDFEFDGDEGTINKMMEFYPENLDWNGGKKVGECIDEMLSKANLQWTAWGNLFIYVTEKGTPGTQFERDLLAGNIDLCDIGNYKEATIGQELNDKSRRIRVVGGRDKHEAYYPCYPDWNPLWTAGIMFNGWELSAFLQKHNLGKLSRYKDLPADWKDYERTNGDSKVVRKWNGKSRDLLTIGEYLDQIPYKSYRIDFTRPLFLVPGAVSSEGDLLFDNPNQSDNFYAVYVDANRLPSINPRQEPLNEDDPDGEKTYGIFYYDRWLKTVPGYGAEQTPVDVFSPRDSLCPIAQNLPTDSNRQFIANTTSRAMHQKGTRNADLFMNGNFTFVTEGASLDIQSYIYSEPDPSFQFTRRNEVDQMLYAVRIIFSEHRFDGEVVEFIPAADVILNPFAPIVPQTAYKFKPAQVYCRLAQEGGVYQFTIGDAETSPRVRENVKQMSDIFRSYVLGYEKPLICQNIIDQGLINNVTADAIASQVAQRALNHEYISTSGHITFRTQAGFMCSGVIESVRVQFSMSTGTSESVNFTNIRNDERVPSYFTGPARNITTKFTEDELKRKALINEQTRLIRDFNAQNGGKAIVNHNAIERSPSIDRGSRAFNEDNQVLVKVDKGANGKYDDIMDGELVILEESPAQQATNNITEIPT